MHHSCRASPRVHTMQRYWTTSSPCTGSRPPTSRWNAMHGTCGAQECTRVPYVFVCMPTMRSDTRPGNRNAPRPSVHRPPSTGTPCCPMCASMQRNGTRSVASRIPLLHRRPCSGYPGWYVPRADAAAMAPSRAVPPAAQSPAPVRRRRRPAAPVYAVYLPAKLALQAPAA